VLSISRRSEELRLYKPGLEFDDLKHRLKNGTVSLNGSPRWKGLLFEGYEWGFLNEGVKTYQMASKSPLNSQTFILYSHL
jgi:hypothetical protein